MANVEDKITVFRRDISDDLIGGTKDDLFSGWLFFTGISCAMVVGASIMTVYWGPGANGSGVAEIIGYLNGINYPNVVGFETLVTKICGVVLAVVGGLCVGKEGPLAHIGSNIGAIVVYLPLPRFEAFQNDWNKRNMMAAGCSAGVSAAFGAPVGGALFAFEISKPNTFWKFSVIWKVFLSCALSVFALSLCSGLMKGEGVDNLSSAVLKFGSIDINPPTLEVLPGAFIVGTATGFLGAIFVIVNSNLGLIRKKYINNNGLKIAEAALFSIMTTTSFYFLPQLFSCCRSTFDLDKASADIAVQYNCPDNEYNPLATMFFNTEGDAIRSIISGFESPGGIRSTDWRLGVFAFVWFFWTIVTYGVWVPAGLFLPGIIIGCAVGGCYAELQAWIMGNSIHDEYTSETLVTPVLVGAGAMLSAYTRLTYSLVVIMLETTSSINIFLPMMIGILVARAVGNLFTASLYDRALRMKQMPFLRSSVPRQNKNLRAHTIMASDVVTLKTISDMPTCKKALETNHNAFPVLNTASRLVGLMPRNILVQLLEKKAFYNKEATDRSSFHTIGDEDMDSSFTNLNDDAPQVPLNGSYIYENGGDTTCSKEFALGYDAKNGFPETPASKILPWQQFTTDIFSSEATGKAVLDQIELDNTYEEWVDLRPYMIESPMTVTVHDKFFRVLEQFRINHLRHIMVVDPSDGSLQGIITRKDIFAYNGL